VENHEAVILLQLIQSLKNSSQANCITFAEIVRYCNISFILKNTPSLIYLKTGLDRKFLDLLHCWMGFCSLCWYIA